MRHIVRGMWVDQGCDEVWNRQKCLNLDGQTSMMTLTHIHIHTHTTQVDEKIGLQIILQIIYCNSTSIDSIEYIHTVNKKYNLGLSRTKKLPVAFISHVEGKHSPFIKLL